MRKTLVNNKQINIKPKYIFCFISGFIPIVFFLHTLNYPWHYFDEQIIYNETIWPIPRVFSEIFEYIKYFGINNYFEASNPFYSSISNIRRDPANNLITLLIYYFFQKNPFLYHTFSTLLHVLNTCLLFLLLNKISLWYSTNSSHNIRLFLTLILSLLWSLHPANIESVLFTTNWSALLTYTFCLILTYYFIKNKDTKSSFIKTLTMFILFIIPLFTCEYSLTLAIILFFYSFINYNFQNPNFSLLQSISHAVKKTMPLLIALMVYAAFFLSSLTVGNINSPSIISTTLQRIFWLSPQIFFHFIKLIFFPSHLSIDQTSMVRLSESFFTPYSMFCSTIFILFIIILLISTLLSKKKVFFLISISFFPFLIALLPFLHILSPAYCLASERYLYFPLLLLIFGLAHPIYILPVKLFDKAKILGIAFLFLILISLSTKSYLRTLDWKDSVSLFTSALNEAPNDLFKGLRLNTLGVIFSRDKAHYAKSNEYIVSAISILERSIEKLKTKNYKPVKVIEAYGLDPKTIEAKSAYLLASIKLSADNDINGTYELLNPYMKSTNIIDAQILDLYLGLLFATKKFDEAESILNYAIKKKLSPITLVIFSELYRVQYNDLEQAKILLEKSFKYFPYDPLTLYKLKNIYNIMNDQEKLALFSYLFGLRMHNIRSLQESAIAFISLNKKDDALRILKKLLNEYSPNQITFKIKESYIQQYGNL